MLSRILTMLLIGAVLTRLLAQWRGFGGWWKRGVDLAFIVIMVIYAVQLLIVVSH